MPSTVSVRCVAVTSILAACIGALGSNSPAAAAPRAVGACGPVSQLTNPSFESPTISTTFPATRNQSAVPGWSTTATDGLIELWPSGFQNNFAAAGVQFAEINATQPATLFQDVPTTPGQSMAWALSHRGRPATNNPTGVDVMEVVIGPPGGALVSQATLSDGSSAWGRHRGSYTVPAGQTITRFGFRSVSSASGNPSFGNFLDDIVFGSFPCLVATKQATDLNGGALEVGDTVTYAVTVENQGGMPALQATLTDAVPAGTSYLAGSMSVDTGTPAGAQTDADDTDAGTFLTGPDRVRFALTPPGGSASTIPPRATVAVSWSVRVLPAAGGTTIVNVGEVGTIDLVTSQPISIPTNQVTNEVAPLVDLQLTKEPAVVAVAPGGLITTTFSVTNAGPSAATGVVVTDRLAAGESFVSSPDGCTTDVGVVTCPIGDLAASATATRQIVVSVDAGAADGTVLDDEAVATAVEDEHTPIDNVDNAVAVVVVAPAVDTDVAVAIVSGPPVPLAGAPAAALVETVNAGPGVADNVVLTIVVPGGASLTGVVTGVGPCQVSGNTATCPIGTMQPGTRVRAVVSGIIDPGLADGSPVALQASVTTTSIERTTANNTYTASRTVAALADVVVGIGELADPIVAGSEIRLPVSVANIGPATARGVVVTIQLPANFAVLDAAGCVVAGSVATCNVGDLTPDSVVRLGLIGTLNDSASGTLNASATATSSSNDPVLANNNDQVSGPIQPIADLSIVKTVSPTTIVVQRPATFTITVTNASPGAATGVVVVDPVPSVIAGATVVVSVGTYDTASGRWAIGTLAAGTSAQMTMTGTSATATTVTNFADISADQFDPVPDDNTTFATATFVSTLPPTGSATRPATVATLLFVAGVAMRLIARRSQSPT